MANPWLETLGGHECCRLSRWHFGFRLEPVQGTLPHGVQPQRYFGSRAPTLTPASSSYLAQVELAKCYLMRGVSQWLVIYRFSLVYCCAALQGRGIAAVFW